MLDSLYQALDSQLILVIAGAGYGKTGALAQFARTEGFTFSWLTLDESEQDLRAFGEALVASLAQCYPGFGQQSLQLFNAAATVEQNVTSLSRTLARELASHLTQPLCIVLDDFHQVEQSVPVLALLDQLVIDLPVDIHLIIASRNLPPLQLGTLIVQQQMVAVGQSVLRFDLDETRDLVAAVNSLPVDDIDAAMVQRAYDVTEGWLVGLLVTSQIDRLREAQIGLSSPRANDLLSDYLLSSVLYGLPPALREFLYRTSVLTEMSPAFCANELKWVDTMEWLSEIERRNLFIQPVAAADGEVVFRYHPLFHEFLANRFRLEEPIRHAQLRREVGLAYERLGGIELAVRHFMLGGWSEDVVRVIENHGLDFVRVGRYRIMLDWLARLDRIAPGVCAERHLLIQFELFSHVNLGHDREAMRLVNELDQLFLRTGDLARRDALNIRRGLLLWRAGDYHNALAGVNVVISSKHPQSLFVQCEARRIAVLCQHEMGRLSDGLDTVSGTEKLIYSGGASMHGEVALMKLARASILGSMGETNEAIRALTEAISLAEEVKDDAILTNALVGLSDELTNNGEIEVAAGTVMRGLELAEKMGNLMLRVIGLSVLARVMAAQAQLDEGMKTTSSGLAIARQITLLGTSSGEILFMPLIEHSHLLCLQAQRQSSAQLTTLVLAQALAHAHEAMVIAESGQSVSLRLRAYTRLGAVQCLQGDLDLATISLDHAAEIRGAFHNVPAGQMCAWQLMTAVRQPQLDAAKIKHWFGELDRLVLLREQSQFVKDEGEWVWQTYQQLKAAHGDVTQTPDVRRSEKSARQTGLYQPQPITTHQANPNIHVVQHEVRASAFGAGRVWRNDDLVTAAQWGWNIPRELFFYMLTHREATRDRIGSVFWSEATTSAMQRGFHNSKFSIRMALGSAPFAYVNGVYTMNPALSYLYDVDEFEKLIETAASAPDKDRLSYLSSAADLYQDEFLIDSQFDWAAPKRQLLAARYYQCCCDAGAAALELGEYQAAIDILERAIQRDELNEDMARMLMTLQWRAGKRRGAIEIYNKLEDALLRELDIRPDPATQELLASIKAS